MAIISYKILPKLRKQLEGKTIVLCSGAFDLTHAGHVLFFEDCKKQGDVLVALVGDDISIKDVKGKGRPILNQNVRLKLVDSLKPVDYCFVGPPPPKDKPLYFMEYVFKHLKPDKYVVNDDAFDMDSRKNFAKKYNMELIVLKRQCPKNFERISSTNIIEKIKRL